MGSRSRTPVRHIWPLAPGRRREAWLDSAAHGACRFDLPSTCGGRDRPWEDEGGLCSRHYCDAGNQCALSTCAIRPHPHPPCGAATVPFLGCSRRILTPRRSPPAPAGRTTLRLLDNRVSLCYNLFGFVTDFTCTEVSHCRAGRWFPAPRRVRSIGTTIGAERLGTDMSGCALPIRHVTVLAESAGAQCVQTP